MKFRSPIVILLICLTLACVPGLKAQDGLRGAFSASGQRGTTLPERGLQLAPADFDNDRKPDGALLRDAGLLNGERTFRIEIHVTAGANNSITFASNESGLAISALDVNRDGAPDIVIERAFTHERLQIYLNDGHGAFHKARAEDYPSSDPSSPTWHARLTQPSSTVFLPTSGSSELGSAQQITMLSPTRSATFKLWCEGLLIQSAARAPSSPRAPPSLSL